MATALEIEPGHGRRASWPSAFPWTGWKDILRRVYVEFQADRITLVAAGATFYLLLALFPALAAFVSVYGFVADPVTVADHIAFLGSVLPSGGLDLIRAQLQSLTAQNSAALTFGFVVGLLVALWSANNGVKTLFEALNVVYDEDEKRSFLKLNLISLVFTLGAIFIGVLFIVSVGVVPAILAFVGLSDSSELLISLARWPVLFIASAFAMAVLYRYGPSREYAKWRWLTWGSVMATALWIVASILFSWYLANFADYNATYGSLGAVIGFMMWTWISVVILLLGAELNSEMEHQTAVDSTTGAPLPMGMRGATMADTLGVSYGARGASAAAELKERQPMSYGEDPGLSVPTRTRTGDPTMLVTVAGLVTALGIVLFLDARDWSRGRAAPRQEPRPRPFSAAMAMAIGDRARAALADPAMRARLVQAGRVLGRQASRIAANRLGTSARRKRGFWR